MSSRHSESCIVTNSTKVLAGWMLHFLLFLTHQSKTLTLSSACLLSCLPKVIFHFSFSTVILKIFTVSGLLPDKIMQIQGKGEVQFQWASFNNILVFLKFVVKKGPKKSLHWIPDVFLSCRTVCTCVLIIIKPIVLVSWKCMSVNLISIGKRPANHNKRAWDCRAVSKHRSRQVERI